MINHKRGDSFDQIATIPVNFADGYFIGWAVTAQVRTQFGAILSDIICTWVDPLTTRMLNLKAIDTSAWAVGLAEFDVQFRRASDDYTISTETLQINVIKDVTQP